MYFKDPLHLQICCKSGSFLNFIGLSYETSAPTACAEFNLTDSLGEETRIGELLLDADSEAGTFSPLKQILQTR
jgi:hypothetical protein